MNPKLPTAAALPSLPTVAVQLLQAYADPNQPLDRIVAIIEMDPAITMKVLKFANSPMYGRGGVETLNQAVLWLGRHTLTCLVLSFSLSEDAQRKGPYAELYQEYWLQSVIQAVTMKLLFARHDPKQAEAAFVSGLLMDIGRLAMLKANPENYASYSGAIKAGRCRQRDSELAALGETHAEASAALLDNCGFPAAIVRMAQLHDVDIDRLLEEAEQEDFVRLAAVNVASAVADFFVGVNAAESLRKLNRLSSTVFDMTNEEIDQFLDDVRGRLSELSDVFVADPELLPPPTELLAAAMEQLVMMSLKPGDSATEGDGREPVISDENAALRARISELERKTCVDPLTKLYNRGYFQQRLQQRLQLGSTGSRKPAVLFLDLDKFKKVNDTFGHPVGDEVLKSVGQVLQATVRTNDIAARYGGEEFVVLLNNVDEDSVQIVTERIRARIEQSQIDIGEGRQIQVTASIGAALCDGALAGVEDCAEKIILAADEAMYDAKRSGGNMVAFRRQSHIDQTSPSLEGEVLQPQRTESGTD